MKAIHLAAVFTLALFPVVNSSAAAPGVATWTPSVVANDGGEEGDVPGDFNEDGNPDLLWQNSSTGELQVWLMRGVEPVERTPTNPSSPGAGLKVVGTDDFNGDGRTDILFWRPTSPLDTAPATPQFHIWYMDGVEGFFKADIKARVTGYRPASILDFNRDGSPDILFQSMTNPNDVFVLLLQNNLVIGKARLTIQSTSLADFRIVGSGDFDRDGDADLVIHYERTGVVAVVLMNGATGTTRVLTQLPDRNWVIRAVGDFKRDGWPDLMLENVMTGETGFWGIVKLQVVERRIVTGPSPILRNWDIVGPR